MRYEAARYTDTSHGRGQAGERSGHFHRTLYAGVHGLSGLLLLHLRFLRRNLGSGPPDLLLAGGFHIRQLQVGAERQAACEQLFCQRGQNGAVGGHQRVFHGDDGLRPDQKGAEGTQGIFGHRHDNHVLRRRRNPHLPALQESGAAEHLRGVYRPRPAERL